MLNPSEHDNNVEELLMELQWYQENMPLTTYQFTLLYSPGEKKMRHGWEGYLKWSRSSPPVLYVGSEPTPYTDNLQLPKACEIMYHMMLKVAYVEDRLNTLYGQPSMIDIEELPDMNIIMQLRTLPAKRLNH